MIVLLIIIITVVVIANLNKHKKNKYENHLIPTELSRIRYVRVTCVDWRDNKREFTAEFDGTVKWSPSDDGWQMFIDSFIFGEKMIEKKNFIFMDDNKNVIPMQGYSCSVYEICEGDCGMIVIRDYKESV